MSPIPLLELTIELTANNQLMTFKWFKTELTYVEIQLRQMWQQCPWKVVHQLQRRKGWVGALEVKVGFALAPEERV